MVFKSEGSEHFSNILQHIYSVHLQGGQNINIIFFGTGFANKPDWSLKFFKFFATGTRLSCLLKTRYFIRHRFCYLAISLVSLSLPATLLVSHSLPATLLVSHSLPATLLVSHSLPATLLVTGQSLITCHLIGQSFITWPSYWSVIHYLPPHWSAMNYLGHLMYWSVNDSNKAKRCARYNGWSGNHYISLNLHLADFTYFDTQIFC